MKFNKTNSSRKINKEYFEAKELGTTINAYTTADYTTFFVKSSFSVWKKIVKLLMHIVFDTNFSKNNIEIERKVILEEKAMRDEHHNNLKHLDKLYLTEDNPYITKSWIGTKESIMKLSNEDIQKYNDLHYAVNNCVFLISCNKQNRKQIIEYTTKVLKRIRNIKWETENKKITDDCMYKQYDYQLQVNMNLNCKYNKVLLYFRSFSLTSEHILYVPMIDYIITNALYKHLREKKGYVYKIYCSHQSQMHVGVARVSFTTTYDRVSKLIKSIVKIIQNLTNSKKNYEKEKQNYINYFDNEVSYNIENLSTLMENVVFSKENIEDSVMLRDRIQNFSYENFKDMIKYIFDVNVMSAMIISKNKSVDYHIETFKKSLSL